MGQAELFLSPYQVQLLATCRKQPFFLYPKPSTCRTETRDMSPMCMDEVSDALRLQVCCQGITIPSPSSANRKC